MATDGKVKMEPTGEETKADSLDLERVMKAFAELPSKGKKTTHLDWSNHSFRMADENQLTGDDNWEMWKTAFWVALMSTGFTKDDVYKLTSIDDAKVANIIIGNIKDGPMAVVAGLVKGTDMYQALDEAYGHYSIDQQADLWTNLQFIKWNPTKQSALEHVVEFKRLIRRTGEVKLPTNSGQQFVMFINSIRDDRSKGAAGWKARIKGLLRHAPNTTMNQVYDDFVAEFRGKDHKKDGIGGCHKVRGGKPDWNDKGQPRCYKCREYGHIAAGCPKKEDGNSMSSDEKAIPADVLDLYRRPAYVG